MVGFSNTTPVEDDLYREIVLEHYSHPRHRGELETASSRVDATNPLCGDELSLAWRVEGGRISGIAFSGRGCSISMASASMLCEALDGQDMATAADIAARFRSMLLDKGPSDGLGDLEALRGVAAYPVRIKCAVLAWNALLQELAGTAETEP